jgi:site-specific DNA-methyltransferase (adenine-specific)
MINTIIHGDAFINLQKIESNSVDLVITSPPYNKNYWLRNRSQKGKRIITYNNFNDALEPNEYINQQREIIKELIRIIKPTGSIFYNHIDIFCKHTTIYPNYIHEFPLKQIIVWDRGNTPKLDKSYFFPTTEWIFWIKKTIDAKPFFDKSKALHNKNIWRINKEKNNIHPAPFPKELVNNIILSCSKENDIILDCYIGSGTTAICAIENKRRYIGIEQSDEYIQLINERILKINN